MCQCDPVQPNESNKSDIDNRLRNSYSAIDKIMTSAPSSWFDGLLSCKLLESSSDRMVHWVLIWADIIEDFFGVLFNVS